MTNAQVVKAWHHGQSARSRHMWTDGHYLQSYALTIGVTSRDALGRWTGLKIARRYTAPMHFVSMTTSQHVGMACSVAHYVIEDWTRDDKFE